MTPNTVLTLALALAGTSAFALTAHAQADPPPFRDNASVGVGASIDVEDVESKLFFDLDGPEPTVDGLFLPEVRVHSAKFVCGQVPADEKHPEKPEGEFAFKAHALTPGTYLTAINIFNPDPIGPPVALEKFAFLAPPERLGDNGPKGPSGALNVDGEFDVVLGGGQAIEIDCITINEELLGGDASGVVDGKNPVDFPLLKGFVAIVTECGQEPPKGTANGFGPNTDLFLDLFCPELQVTAVYTYKNVEAVAGKDGGKPK